MTDYASTERPRHCNNQIYYIKYMHHILYITYSPTESVWLLQSVWLKYDVSAGLIEVAVVLYNASS